MAGINTGTSTIGIAFEGGVIVAADTLASYGSMARFKSCQRIMTVNDTTVVAATGDLPDFQYISSIIKQKQIDEIQWNDGLSLYPAALHSWLTRVAYNRRSKFQPIWCQWLVAGLQPNESTGKFEPFVGFVDKLGTAYKDTFVTTGFGMHLATPLIREVVENLNRLPTEQEARDLIVKCMHVLYYRDARSWPKYQIAVVKHDGDKIVSTIEQPEVIKGDWHTAIGVVI